MYQQNDGRRLSDWQVNEGPLDSYHQGPSLTQRVLGPSSWSFGEIHETIADHLLRQSSAQREELRSPQNFAPKQEYSTPPQRFLNGRHGTPITISSGGSWILDEAAPARPTLKRAGSPSMMYEAPAKRQQACNSPGMMQLSRPISDNSRQLFFEERPQTYETRYINEGQLYRQEIPVRSSQSPYGQSPQAKILHERLLHKRSSDPQQHISPQQEPIRRQPSTYQSSPLHRSDQQHWSGPSPLQRVVTYEQDGEHFGAQPQHRQVDQYGMDEQYIVRQATAASPKGQLQLQNNNSVHSLSRNAYPEDNPGRKQQPQLGSPLWPNAKVARNVAQSPPEVRVQGHHVVRAGSMQIPEDQIDRRHISEIPFTPSRQRAKTPGLASQQRPSTSQRGRSKSVAPAGVREAPESQSHEEKMPYQPPSVEEAPEDDVSESTPLNEVLRRQQCQRQTSRNDFEEGSYKIASVLPQESIFGPKTTKEKPTASQLSLPRALQQSPEVISLLSTPDAGAASPPLPAIRSVPMKDRITPAKKPPAKQSAATPMPTGGPKKSTPKTPQALKKQKAKVNAEEPRDPAIVMQKRAADIIVNKEIQGAGDAMDLDLFGEVVGMTEEEKEKREEEMHAESQRKLIHKATELQAKEEAEQLADMEKMRAKAEKEEKERLDKEVEEEKAKARRDAERKRREALEERERDELRRKAAEKIEADRKKATEEAERREQLKRVAEKRAEKVQAEAEELAKLKAMQEQAKKQAASLHVAKISMTEGSQKADGGDVNKDGDVVIEEDSLFLPENEPELAETDDGSRAKSDGPTSAAQVFAQSGAKARISAYRAEKEEAELRREKLLKESRLSERWKRQEVKKAMQQAPPPEPAKERSTSSKVAKKECPPPKSQAQSVISPPPPELASATEDAVSQPILPSFTSFANMSFGSNKSAPALLPPPKPQVKLISQLERERIESEAHTKQANKNAAKKARRSEEQKAERRKKENEKTRARQRQRLVDDANQKGVQLSEENLEAQVEAHITKLEVQRQRRREKDARQQSIQDFTPDNLALEALLRPHNHSSEFTESYASTVDDEEELTLEEQIRRANEAAMKESMKALARQRGSSFARAAAKKTVADFQTDSESEEDPEPEPSKDLERDNSGDGSRDSDSCSETDNDEANAVKQLNPDDHDAQIVPPLPNMTASFERRNRSRKHQPEIFSVVRDLVNNPNSEHQLVMLYTVKKELNFHGEDGPGIILHQSYSRKEANDVAAAEVQKLRQRPTQSISEGYDDENLYCATVTYERGDKNQAFVYVIACPVSLGERVDFDPAGVDNRIPEKTYFVWQYITKRKTDEETGETHIHHNIPKLLGHFSKLEMANHHACTELITLLKPKNPKMEFIEQHAKQFAPMIREKRDEANKERKVFEVEVERDNTQVQWVTFDAVEVAVKLVEIKGPRN